MTREIVDDKWLVQWEDSGEHWVEFNVWKIIGKTTDGELVYENCVYSLEEAELHLHGSIKWDGCCDFHVTDCLHFCDISGMNDHCDLLRWLYEQASQRLAAVWNDEPLHLINKIEDMERAIGVLPPAIQ